jgi:hypothetical protein
MQARDERSWRPPLAGALAATAAAVLWLLSVDPKGVASGPGLLGAATALAGGLGLAHVAAAVCTALGLRRAAGWLAIAAGGWPLAACAVALALPGHAGRDARALAAFLLLMSGPVVAAPVLALALAHVALVDLGRRTLVAAGPSPATRRAWGACFVAIAVAATGFSTRSWSWWLGSRDRRELVSMHRAVDARQSLVALGHCLREHAAATGGGYPHALEALPRGDERCAGAFAPDAAFPDHELRYLPGEPDAAGRRARFSLVLLPRAPERRAFGGTRLDETGAQWEGVAEDGSGGHGVEDVASRIELVSLEIERARLDSETGAYPASLADTGVLPAGALARRAACGDCVVEAEIEAGRALGFRFAYAPDARAGGYRLDVRPARFGEPFTRSYLCTPEGLLRYTDEDRAAEPSDPVLWPYPHLQDPTADDCTGRGEAEAILRRVARR